MAFHEINRFKVKTLPLAPFLSRDGETRANIPSSRNGSKWKTKVRLFQKRANLTRAEVSEFIECMRKQNESFNKLTVRVQTNLASSYMDIKKTKKWDWSSTPVIVQIDQDVPRQPVTRGIMPCVIPGGVYWLCYGSYEEHRIVAAGDLLSLQGIGKEEMAEFNVHPLDKTLMRDVAGNAFCGPVALSVLVSCLMVWDRHA